MSLPQAAVLAQRQECINSSVSCVSSDSFLQSLCMGEVQGMRHVKHLEGKKMEAVGEKEGSVGNGRRGRREFYRRREGKKGAYTYWT